MRDVRVEVGAAVTRALAAPLGLVLDSARWLVNDITARYREYFADLLERESAGAGGVPVPLQRLLTMASPHLSAGWSGRGVSGRCFAEQHPDRATLIAAEHADRGPRRVITIPAKDHPDVTSRTSPPSDILGPGELYWSSAITDSLDPPEADTVLPGAAMTVMRRGSDLVVQVMPSGTELDFFEVIADAMTGVLSDAFQPVAPAAHRPRITIDRFVLSWEQWTFQVADSAWAFAKDEQERYYLARRWRQDHGLPERVFYRVPVEYKPAAADFRSIVLVNLLAKNIRQTQAAGHTGFTVTEMLPDLDQLWLTDREGRRYSSELRIVAYDGMR